MTEHVILSSHDLFRIGDKLGELASAQERQNDLLEQVVNILKAY